MVTAVRRRLPQQGGPAAQLPVPQHLGQQLALRLWQQHDAKDAEQGAGGQHHMLQEGPVAHVQALGWPAQPPERSQSQDQTQATTPGERRKRVEEEAWTCGLRLSSAPSLPAFILWGPSSLRPGPALLSPHSGGDNFGSQENAEDGGRLGGEQPQHREGGNGGLIEICRTDRG